MENVASQLTTLKAWARGLLLIQIAIANGYFLKSVWSAFAFGASIARLHTVRDCAIQGLPLGVRVSAAADVPVHVIRARRNPRLGGIDLGVRRRVATDVPVRVIRARRNPRLGSVDLGVRRRARRPSLVRGGVGGICARDTDCGGRERECGND